MSSCICVSTTTPFPLKNPDLFIGDYTMIEKAVDTELDILLNSQV